MEYSKKFYQRLKSLIQESDKLQKEIANDLNIPETTFSGYVRGKSRPDIETLVIIAEYFNVNTDYLLGLSDIKGGGSILLALRAVC